MEIVTRDYKRSNIIRVNGRVDASTYGQLESTLKEYIDTGRTHLVLEMDGTEFLSSAGVRVLISAQKALKPRGQKHARRHSRLLRLWIRRDLLAGRDQPELRREFHRTAVSSLGRLSVRSWTAA